MPSAAPRRLGVRFDDGTWREAVRGFSGRALAVATSSRARVERDGVALGDVRPCAADGADGTQLAGCAKIYLPIADAPPSQRPYAFVLQLARDDGGTLSWVFVAFGVRHPGPGIRSVYERAHRRLHGRFPAR